MAHRCFWLLPLVLLLALAQPVFAAGPGRSAEIDPRVLEDLSTGSARLILRLKDPLSPPDILNSKELLQSLAARQVASLRQAAGAAQAALAGELQAQGLSYRSFWIINAISLEANAAALARLAARPDVLAIESDRAFQVRLEHVSDTVISPAEVTAVQVGLDRVKAPALWSLGFRGKDMVAASADTGVEWQHPALQGRYRGWNGSTANHNYSWWDAIHSRVNPSSSTNACGYDLAVPCDDYGHGTHTTGTMVGVDGSQQIGMAPEAKWIACRNMDQGWGSPSTYIECLQFFLAPTDLEGNHPNPALRPHVIDNSYSCPPNEGCQADSLHDAIQQVRAAGIFMAVSAGNDGPACGTIAEPPANEAGVFTVGGVGIFAGSSNVMVYGSSSRGPVTDGQTTRQEPDLVAPAMEVISSIRGGGYGSMTGTSMAAPHVAGAVALLWSGLPEIERSVPATETLLRFSAERLPVFETCGGLPSGTTPNNATGWGLLDVLAAYQHYPLKQIFFPIVAYQN